MIADFRAALDWAGRARPGLPRFALGHSNGGQVVLRAALEPSIAQQVEGLILSSPSLRLATRVPAVKLLLGPVLLHYAPLVTLSASLHSKELTRDPVMQTRHRDD